MLLLRHIVLLEDGVYRANPKETMLLAYYGNAIAHLLNAGSAPMRPVLAATAAASAKP